MLSAFGIAKMQEACCSTKANNKNEAGSTKAPLALPALKSRASVPIQRLFSHIQRKEQRDKGLCYNCDKKGASGHNYNITKLFIRENVRTLEMRKK